MRESWNTLDERAWRKIRAFHQTTTHLFLPFIIGFCIYYYTKHNWYFLFSLEHYMLSILFVEVFFVGIIFGIALLKIELKRQREKLGVKVSGTEENFS